MANTDPGEWRLYDTNLTTQLAILPSKSSHIYLELNEPGSGSLDISLDAAAASNVGVGKFAALFYRGSFRAGFFVDNIKYTDADSGEGGGRNVNISGRGALALLEQSVIWSLSTDETERTFTNVTKASILLTLIDEAQARGELATLAYNFTADVDSAAVPWTDSEIYSLPVGTSLLDVARQFAETGGFDFTLTFAAGVFTLGAYSAGSGSDISSTMYFRIGSNCEEVGRDTRSDELYNYYLVKWKGGYITVSDATSISTYGLRTKFLSLEQAQSSASATTYAAAKLALTKDPRANKTIKVYDGINPRLFVDYDMADTVSLDRFGTVTSDKVLGIQADFDGSEFARVVIDFNVIMYDNEMKMSSDLDWLLDQWNTAHDGNLLEVKQAMGIGFPNGQVNAIHSYGDYIYVGGGFTYIGALLVNYIAQYQISTGTWSAMSTTITQEVRAIIDIAGTIHACTTDKVYSWNGSAWTLLGTATAGDLRCMATDGTNLFVGGSVTTISGVSILGKVAKRSAGVWTDQNPNSVPYNALSMAWFDGNLHVGFTAVIPGQSGLKRYAGGGTNLLNLDSVNIRAMIVVDGNLIFSADDGATDCTIWSWDGVSIGPGQGSAVTIGSITDYAPSTYNSFSSYLTDVYYGADFSTIDGVSGFNGIARYSGGLWSMLGTGLSTASGDTAHAVEVVGSDVYIGGIFTSFDGNAMTNLTVYVTDFQSMIDHLSLDNRFDLGAEIHNATAAAITDAGELPFWDAVTGLLRKITWTNIKTTLKAAIKLDEWAATTDVTTLNATTSAHGLLLKATAPAANVLNVVGIANGETAYTNKTVLDSTNPAAIGTAAPGTSLVFSHRDHVHAGSFLSLTNLPTAETNANDIFRVDSPGGVSLWTGTISGAPSGASVTVSAPASGTEAVLVPTSTSQLGKMRLRNITRGDYALISNYNTGTNVVTLTANAPAAWANGDSLSVVSATVSGGGKNWVDIEITSVLTGKTSIFVALTCFSATATDQGQIHPLDTYSASKAKSFGALVSSQINEYGRLIPLISNTFSLCWVGTPTAIVIREEGYLQ